MTSGLSPLEIVCLSGRWSARSFTLLLQRGADIMGRDVEGETCLHHCLSCNWGNGTSSYIHQYSAGIIVLIRYGADVYAKNIYDRSASDMAYADYPDDSTWVGCARGDVWDFCLAVTNHNVSEFRQGRSRKAYYGRRYTRRDFEGLWAGHEHLCPYYYDAEDEPANSAAPSDDESEEEWVTTDSEDGGSEVIDLEGE